MQRDLQRRLTADDLKAKIQSVVCSVLCSTVFVHRTSVHTQHAMQVYVDTFQSQ